MKTASSLVQVITLAACFTVYVAACGEIHLTGMRRAMQTMTGPAVHSAGLFATMMAQSRGVMRSFPPTPRPEAAPYAADLPAMSGAGRRIRGELGSFPLPPRMWAAMRWPASGR